MFTSLRRTARLPAIHTVHFKNPRPRSPMVKKVTYRPTSVERLYSPTPPPPLPLCKRRHVLRDRAWELRHPGAKCTWTPMTQSRCRSHSVYRMWVSPHQGRKIWKNLHQMSCPQQRYHQKGRGPVHGELRMIQRHHRLVCLNLQGG